ncbi:MAG: 2Fe-2S iron-sulfur cluster-binding protein, partial [Casimicrobiaceae bacterium]
MTQPYRLPAGGSVDRANVLRFEYDGVGYAGYAGDTLASALLANGVHLVGRSFKYHRPRGIVSAGTEEPNALVQLARGDRAEPNARATTLELYDGLIAASQNCWPSVRFDIGAINNLIARFIPAGFYYKTFMWPPSPRWWLKYEHVIRHAAGMGRAGTAPDPDRYEHQYAHCDVLVIGGGTTGLAAASAAAGTGAHVMVCDENPRWGGGALDPDITIDGIAAAQWCADTVQQLATQSNVTLLLRTTAFGFYDGNLVGAVERVADHLASQAPGAPRQRLWKIRAKAVVLASGAIERGIVFANNDLPGTMLANAARTYVQRYGVRPGKQAVVFTNNDGAYADALVMHAAGIAVAAVVDVRPESQLSSGMPTRARAAGIPVRANSVIVGAHGTQHVAAVDIALQGGGPAQRVHCDLVCVSGGWNPAVHLFSQARGKLRYDDALAAFVPASSPMPILPAGAANGRFDLAAALLDGHAAGIASAARAGSGSTTSRNAPRAISSPAAALQPLWAVPAGNASAKRFVDLQNDVTVDDIALAAREGYQAVEHLKRYTTLGMGTDQGKTS